MRDSEPSLWDVLFGTPKKKGKEKKSNIFEDDWEERCSECDEYYEDCECEDCPDDDCRNQRGGR